MFTVCTPYNPPTITFIPLETIVNTKLPNFAYQFQLASGIVEEKIQTREGIKKFLNGLYGGKGSNGEKSFTTSSGLLFENLDKLNGTKLLDKEMLDYYTCEYSGMAYMEI